MHSLISNQIPVAWSYLHLLRNHYTFLPSTDSLLGLKWSAEYVLFWHENMQKSVRFPGRKVYLQTKAYIHKHVNVSVRSSAKETLKWFRTFQITVNPNILLAT